MWFLNWPCLLNPFCLFSSDFHRLPPPPEMFKSENEEISNTWHSTGQAKPTGQGRYNGQVKHLDIGKARSVRVTHKSSQCDPFSIYHFYHVIFKTDPTQPILSLLPWGIFLGVVWRVVILSSREFNTNKWCINQQMRNLRHLTQHRASQAYRTKQILWASANLSLSWVDNKGRN